MLQPLMAALLVLLVLCVPAAAQTANPAFTPSGTPSQKPSVPAPHQLNTSDRTFVHQLAIGNMAEIDLGKLAQQKASGEAIKNFAQRMVNDHQQASRRLADLANAASLQLPNGLDDEHRALREHLDKLSGTDFDVAYAQAQLQEHQRTVQLLDLRDRQRAGPSAAGLCGRELATDPQAPGNGAEHRGDRDAAQPTSGDPAAQPGRAACHHARNDAGHRTADAART